MSFKHLIDINTVHMKLADVCPIREVDNLQAIF